jgi:tRNA-specific 2-thiouridylase
MIGRRDDLYVLKRSPDPVKDQSYFLSHLTQTQLARALFPIGDLSKSRVRELARDWNLPNQARKDSQGICFLGKVRYPDFVRHYLGEREGPILERETGRVLGQHRGFWFYTTGQRTGLGLSGGPWYVTGKDPDQNIVLVSHGEAKHDQRTFTVGEVNWIADNPFTRPPRESAGAAATEAGGQRQFLLKIRHGPALATCTATPQPGERYRVTMDPPDAGIAPGQFAIFYEDEECLGGGVIEEVEDKRVTAQRA